MESAYVLMNSKELEINVFLNASLVNNGTKMLVSVSLDQLGLDQNAHIVLATQSSLMDSANVTLDIGGMEDLFSVNLNVISKPSTGVEMLVSANKDQLELDQCVSLVDHSVVLVKNYVNANMDIFGITLNGGVLPNATTISKYLLKTDVFVKIK